MSELENQFWGDIINAHRGLRKFLWSFDRIEWPGVMKVLSVLGLQTVVLKYREGVNGLDLEQLQLLSKFVDQNETFPASLSVLVQRQQERRKKKMGNCHGPVFRKHQLRPTGTNINSAGLPASPGSSQANQHQNLNKQQQQQQQQQNLLKAASLTSRTSPTLLSGPSASINNVTDLRDSIAMEISTANQGASDTTLRLTAGLIGSRKSKPMGNAAPYPPPPTHATTIIENTAVAMNNNNDNNQYSPDNNNNMNLLNQSDHDINHNNDNNIVQRNGQLDKKNINTVNILDSPISPGGGSPRENSNIQRIPGVNVMGKSPLFEQTAAMMSNFPVSARDKKRPHLIDDNADFESHMPFAMLPSRAERKSKFMTRRDRPKTASSRFGGAHRAPAQPIQPQRVDEGKNGFLYRRGLFNRYDGSGPDGPNSILQSAAERDKVYEKKAEWEAGCRSIQFDRTNPLLLKQRKRVVQNSKMLNSSNKAVDNRNIATLTKSFTHAGRQNCEDFCATTMIAPIHWSSESKTSLEKKRRKAKTASLRRAIERDLQYQNEIRARRIREFGTKANEREYYEKLTKHIFIEIHENANTTSNAWRILLPPVYVQEFMTPAYDTVCKKPPPFQELLTYWWQKKKGQDPPKNVSGGGSSSQSLRKSGTGSANNSKGFSGDDGETTSKKDGANKEVVFTQREAAELFQVIFAYQDCLTGLKKESEFGEEASNIPPGLRKDDYSDLVRDRLKRCTFCRFLLDTEIVEMDSQVIANCGRLTKAGFLYSCQCFDYFSTHPDIKCADPTSGGGNMKAAANHSPRDRDDNNPASARSAAAADRRKSDMANGRMSKDSDEPTVSSFGSISIKTQFLLLMETILQTFEIDFEIFFEESLPAARNRINQIVFARNQLEIEMREEARELEESDLEDDKINQIADESAALNQVTGPGSEGRKTAGGRSTQGAITGSVAVGSSVVANSATSEAADVSGIKKRGTQLPPAIGGQLAVTDKTGADGGDNGNRSSAVMISAVGGAAARDTMTGDSAALGSETKRSSQKGTKSVTVDNSIDFMLQYKSTFLYTRWMFCEPEMWLFLYQFDTIFEEIFEQYVDFPTDILGCEQGHMSFGAFLRFLVDFRFFPNCISYVRAYDVYHDAECTIYQKKREKDTDEMSAMLGKMCASNKKNDTQNKGTRGVLNAKAFRPTLAKKTKKDSTPNNTNRVSAFEADFSMDDSDINQSARTSRVGPGKKSIIASTTVSAAAANTDSTVSSNDNSDSEPEFTSSRLVRPKEYEGDANFWQKPFEAMTKFEYVTWGVLSALEAWLHDRGGQISKIFNLFDIDGDKTISCDEFYLGLMQTRLDPIPTPEEIRYMFDLIDDDSDGTLSLMEMHKVMQRFAAEREKKTQDYKHNTMAKMTQGNTFLKIEDFAFAPPVVYLVNENADVMLEDCTEPSSTEGESEADSQESNDGAIVQKPNKGNIVQQSTSSYVKGLWLMAYMRSFYVKYSQGFDEMIAEENNQVENAGNENTDMNNTVHNPGPVPGLTDVGAVQAVAAPMVVKVVTEGGSTHAPTATAENGTLKKQPDSDSNNNKQKGASASASGGRGSSNSPQSRLTAANARGSAGGVSQANSGAPSGAASARGQKSQIQNQGLGQKSPGGGGPGDANREKTEEDFTAEQQKLLDKIQSLLSTAKTEYLSPLERLLKIKWDPFDSMEIYDKGLESRCNYCYECIDQDTGFPLCYNCIGCSVMTMDTDLSLGTTSMWSLVQPADQMEDVDSGGFKLRFADIASDGLGAGGSIKMRNAGTNAEYYKDEQHIQSMF